MHAAAGFHERAERAAVLGHVAEILVDVAGEHGASLLDARDEPGEAGKRNALFGAWFPARDAARRRAPRTADRAPIELPRGAAVRQVAEPIHVGPELAHVTHPVRVRRRGDDAREARAFEARL